VQRVYPELQQLGAEVLVVSFAPPPRVAAYLAKYPQPFPVVSDPSLAAYRAFALERTPVRTLFRLGVIGRYLRLMFRGWLPKKPGGGEDILQLGGDFLLDADGVVRYAHPSTEPTDRPSAAELLEQARRLRFAI
jgi:peroxiredoxin